jgi:hypothetical protein
MVELIFLQYKLTDFTGNLEAISVLSSDSFNDNFAIT